MPLNERQTAFYKHRVTIWRGVRADPDPVTKKRPDGVVWTLIKRGVACLYVYTNNVSDAMPGAGRIKRPTQFTNDEVRFAADETVLEGDIVVNTSLDSSGTHVPGVYGECSRLLGQPKVLPQSGNRNANYRAFQIQSMEDPPVGVGV